MKRFLVSLYLSCFSLLTFALEISGAWNVLLNVGGQTMPVILTITRAECADSGTLDRPQKNAFGMQFISVALTN